MKTVSLYLAHRQWLGALALMAACLPAHAQQAGEEPPASPRPSVWLPPGASLTPELSQGISVSALGQQVDPGVQQWQVRRADISVRRMLQRWGQEAGWQLLWDVPRDFQIETELQLSGRIEQVVSAVVESLAITDFPVQARINSELRIIRIGSYLESKAR